MTAFLTTALSFPTIIFGFLLALCVLLWLLTAMGLFDFDTGGDIGDAGDIGGGIDLGDLGDLGDIGDFGDAAGAPHLDLDPANTAQAVGLLSRLGLQGVPITIVISLLSFFGWLIAFQVQLRFLAPLKSNFLYYPVGIAVMVGALFVAIILTAQLCKPLRKVFQQPQAIRKAFLVGKVATVNTSRVDMVFGEALFNDGGAGLHLRIRSPNNNTLTYKDRIVLIKYNPNEDAFLVMSEGEFLALKEKAEKISA